MRTDKLKDVFMELCREYTAGERFLDGYGGTEKRSVTWSFVGRIGKVQLVYRMNESVMVPPSTLHCRVYPNKNSTLFFPMAQLLPMLEKGDYRACCFPYIESEQRMGSCFRAIMEIVEDTLPRLEKLSMAGEDRALLRQWLKSCGVGEEELEGYLRDGSDEQRVFLWAYSAQERAYLAQCTQDEAYYSYLTGDREQALKAYGKRKSLTEFQKGLWGFLEANREVPVPISDECFAWRDMRRTFRGKENMGAVFFCQLAVYALGSILFCALLGVIQVVDAWGTVCWSGPAWYWGFMLAVLPAMFGGILFRRKLIGILFRKTAREQLAFDDVTSDTPLIRWLAGGALAAAGIFCVWMMVMMTGDTMRLYDSYGIVGDTRFGYEEVSQVCYVHGRYNVYGDRIDRASYVVVLEDGSLIDLDGYTSVRHTQQEILPIFEKLDIPLTEADSEEAIVPPEG